MSETTVHITGICPHGYTPPPACRTCFPSRTPDWVAACNDALARAVKAEAELLRIRVILESLEFAEEVDAAIRDESSTVEPWDRVLGVVASRLLPGDTQ